MAEVDKGADLISPVGQTVQSLTITSSTTGSVSPKINGELISIRVDAPNLTTDTTYDLAVVDGDSKTIFTITGIADNSTVVKYPKATTGYLDRIPLIGTETISVTHTTSQTSTWKIVCRFKDR